MSTKGNEARRNTGIWGLTPPESASQEKTPAKLERYVRSDIGSTPLAPLVKVGNIFNSANPFTTLDRNTAMAASAFVELFQQNKAKIRSLEEEMEAQETPNDQLIRNLRAANAEMATLKKQITARFLELYRLPADWILEHWEKFSVIHSTSKFGLDVAFSTLYAHIEFMEQQFELKKAVRLELIAEAKFQLQGVDQVAWEAVNQPEKLSYSSAELDEIMIEKGIKPRSMRDTFSGTGPASSPIYSGPYITGRTERPPMLSPEEVEAEYKRGQAERMAPRSKPWSPAEVAKRRAAALAAQRDINEIRSGTTLRAQENPALNISNTEEGEARSSGVIDLVKVPDLKQPSLPSFDLSSDDLIDDESSGEVLPTTQRSMDVSHTLEQPYKVTISYRDPAIPRKEVAIMENEISRESAEKGLPISAPQPERKAEQPVVKVVPKQPSRWGKFLAAAGAIAVAGITLFGISRTEKSVENLETASSVNSANNTPSATPQVTSAAPVETAKPEPVTPVKKVDQQDKSEAPQKRTFAKVLNNSKSPFVQDIINKGEVKLMVNSGTIVGMFLDTFGGLTNDAQKVEMKELEKTINMGLGVYFNEHFGTEEKAARSIAANPRLKNLYRTAKYAMEKGWTNSGLTKEKYPQEYAFAVAILSDATELGLDESNNPDPKVQNNVRGNMFQAKMPGSTLQVRKANGEYHVILEAVFKIFEGKKMADIMAIRKAAAEMPAQQNVLTPKQDPVKTNQSGTGPFFQNMHIINDIHGHGSLKKTADRLLMEEVDAGWDDLANPARPQTADQTLMDQIDAGWDDIEKTIDQRAVEKTTFEKSQTVEFDLPLEFTTKQENDAMLPRTIEKVVELYPQADAEKIRRIMKQYGWIGMKCLSREKGHIKMEIHPNFYKILKDILREKKKTSQFNS
ncbi:hypothetical protein IT411_02290 [Candidatus Peregrinibacteria bacterium]|nr:hypothetical protein [Candidatus Peregrinibacteria bacterium]